MRGVQRHVLGLQCHEVTDISGRNGSYESIGPGGNVRCLDLVMGAMPGARWVQNDHFERVVVSLKSPFLRGDRRHVLMTSNVIKVAVISGSNG